MNDKKGSSKQVLSAVFGAFASIFGVHEVLFLAGFAAFFYGIQGLWSIFGAFAVCGAILMLIAIISILRATQVKGK